MPSLFKRLTDSLKRTKPKPSSPIILNVNTPKSYQDEAVSPSSSNITSITSLGNPTVKVKSKFSSNKSFLNNNSDSDRYYETWKMGDSNPNEISVVNCLSGYSKEIYSNDTIKSYLKQESEFENQNSSSPAKNDVNSDIKFKLLADHDNLLQKNKKIKKRYEKAKCLNDLLKAEIAELEALNKRLTSDNAETLHEAIKHRFLKLESEDLSKKTDQYKQKLEEKENLIVKFQKQFENIRAKSTEAYKLKEEAQLEASHSCVKLKELTNDCAELDIYKNENSQKKFFFNELQNILGNVRVYLKIKPTVGESCISFLGDDKVLLKTINNNEKQIICQFTQVFQPHVSLKEIFEDYEPLLMTVIDGYNCCFINYGQIGSGKSLTLFGEDNNPGILSSSLNYLISTTEECTNCKYCISLSAVQINKNNIFDIFRRKQINIVDDGENLILKNSDERILNNITQCNEIVRLIELNKDAFKPVANSYRTFTHLVIIVRVIGTCKLSREKTCGIVMFCELAGFENENNLKFSDRDYLKEEKFVQESLIDLGKKLVTLKGKLRKRNPPLSILTKLLQPCLTRNSKCVLFIHCLSDSEERYAITKSIQYGLAVMPKMKTQQPKHLIQWDFCDEN